jgi:hypothetical protein
LRSGFPSLKTTNPPSLRDIKATPTCFTRKSSCLTRTCCHISSTHEFTTRLTHLSLYDRRKTSTIHHKKSPGSQVVKTLLKHTRGCLCHCTTTLAAAGWLARASVRFRPGAVIIYFLHFFAGWLGVLRNGRCKYTVVSQVVPTSEVGREFRTCPGFEGTWLSACPYLMEHSVIL